MLARTVRISLHRPVRQFFADLFSNPAYQPHALDPAQLYDADELRFTRDAAIRASGSVRAIW